MSQNRSKFSGILAQARERETAMPETPQTPIYSGETGKKVPSQATFDEKAALNSTALDETELSPALIQEETLATSTPAVGRPRGKRSDPNFTQITAYISRQTHQNVKLALLNEGQKREISELIEEHLVGWLEQVKLKPNI